MTLYCGTHNWLCVQKMLNHGLNHGFFLLLFKLLSGPIHWIVCVLAYFNFILNFRAVLVLPKTAGSAQTHRSMSFIWIVWSTLYVYLCNQTTYYIVPCPSACPKLVLVTLNFCCAKQFSWCIFKSFLAILKNWISLNK